MVFPVVGGNESKGYEISNSLIFNPGDSPKLTRTNASDGDRQKFTISFWTKRANTGSTHIFFDAGTSTSADTGSFSCSINSSDKLFVGGGATSFRQTNRLFRDTSAWYHIVIAVDTTDSTADDRIKIYVNGVQETSFTTNNAMSQNLNTPVNENGKVHQICNRQKSSSLPFDGYMTEFHFIDGAQKAQTDFGKFDTNGVWVPKKYTGTYGTNGFFMEFKQTGTSANSSGIGADTSGNDNHFTPTNLAATDINVDTCTNNWCTLNPIDASSGSTFTEGNLRIATSVSQEAYNRSTFAMTSGKWYFETKITTGNVRESVGIYKTSATLNDGTQRIAYYSRYGHILKGNSQAASGAAYGDNDIISTAFNLDDSTVTFYKNGSSQGTVTSIDSATWSPMFQDASNAYACGGIYNFGNNGSFSGTVTAQGNSDGNGYGDFYYSVPSGYYSINSKNLAEFG